MLERHFKADRINEIVNDPDVYEWVHGPIVGSLDLTPVLADRRNVCLVGEHGAMVFHCLQPGLYDVHTQTLKSGRGRWTMKMVHEALHWMFCRTDAIELLSRVPHGNIGARTLIRMLGGTFEFTRPNSWIKNRELISSDIYSWKIQDWMRTAPGLEQKGKEFHIKLEREYDLLGVKEAVHPEDSNHDRYVGATSEMIAGGQPYKAVIFYNRWARMAGYQEIQILSAQPVILDIRDSILLVKNNDIKVMSCRLAQQ